MDNKVTQEKRNELAEKLSKLLKDNKEKKGNEAPKYIHSQIIDSDVKAMHTLVEYLPGVIRLLSQPEDLELSIFEEIENSVKSFFGC